MFYNALSGFNAFTLPAAPGGGYIVSVQSFSITMSSTTSGTATISAVDTSKSFIVYGGLTTTRSSRDCEDMRAAVTLTNSTTVTATRIGSLSSVSVTGAVVEFNSSFISSVQSGQITLSAVASNTATISSVDTSRSFVLWGGDTSTDTSTAIQTAFSTVELTDSTTVTARLPGAGTVDTTSYFTVVELQAAVVSSLQQVLLTTSANTTTHTATISSVDLTKTGVFYGGYRANVANYTTNYMHLEITNSTTLTAVRASASLASRSITATVIEFAAGVLASSPQNFLAVQASATSVVATISSVNTAKSFVNWLGQSTTATTDPRAANTDSSLTSATQVTTTSNLASTITKTTSVQVLEFT